MTKKDYITFANIIKKAKERDKNNEAAQVIANEIASELCIHFKMDNGAFRAFTFLEACGVK
jgi:hypothetical protein